VIFTVRGNAPDVFAVTDMVAFVASVAGIPDNVKAVEPALSLRPPTTIPGGTLDVTVIGVPAKDLNVTVIGGIASPIVKFCEGTLDVAESELDDTVKLSVFDPRHTPFAVTAVITLLLAGASVVGVPEISPAVEILNPAGRASAP